MKTQFSSPSLKDLSNYIGILFLVSISINSFSQSSCVNADFELNSFAGWTGTTGYCCPINSTTPGLVLGRQTIMTGAGTDPFSQGLLTVVAPGGLYSAQLGNSNTGSQAEQLIYSFNVTANNEMFIYRYAVVFEDPGHPAADQPRFEIRVFDQNGAPIACGSYFVYSTANIPGFHTVHINGDTYHWKDWTAVGIDLSSYVGQTVTIEFSTGDCALGAHFGYAYVDCYCSPLTISSDYCVGNPTATMTAPPGFNSYLWNTGATTQSITINNPQLNATYTVTVVSVSGCSVSLTHVITPTTIVPNFTVQTQCSGSAQFTNTSSQLTNASWDFGDGTVSTDISPIHQYAAPGIYNVTLNVGNQAACDSNITIPVNIISGPIPDFSFTAQCIGAPVQFSDLSASPNGSIAFWIWDFGDGLAISSLQNPSHSYASPNNYNVTLVVRDTNNCVDTITKQIIVLPNPEALFSFNSGCLNKMVTFTDSSFISIGGINSWFWNFGDNSPISSQQNAVHQYASPGLYNVQLITTSGGGCSDTTSAQVDVFSSPDAGFTFAAQCAGRPVQFSDRSTSPIAISTWAWEMGDGSPVSSLQNPVHIYTTENNYNVSLMVTDLNGCVDTIVNQLTVLPSPDAAFAADALCLNSPANFTDYSSISSGSISNWQWDFGDNSPFASHQNESHFYTLVGLYNVQLVVMSNNGCSDTAYNKITLYPSPTAGFSFEPSVLSVLDPTVYFTDESIDGSQWTYLLGDGDSTSQQNPMHTYHNIQSSYVVWQHIISPFGCVDSIAKTIEVKGIKSLYVPNAFTPNADAFNGGFKAYGLGITTFEMTIYDRWGLILFRSNNIDDSWDGNYNGAPSQADVYVYKINAEDVFKEKYNLIGKVTLIR